MVAAAHERQHVALEALDDRLEVLAVLRRRAGQARAHLGGRRAAQGRDRRVGQPRDQHVDGAVAERAHRLRIHPEWIVCAALATHPHQRDNLHIQPIPSAAFSAARSVPRDTDRRLCVLHLARVARLEEAKFATYSAKAPEARIQMMTPATPPGLTQRTCGCFTFGAAQ